MALVWEHAFEHNEMLVMLALADHADHDGGSIFPSVDRIAWKTAYSEKQVRNIIAMLRRRGILVVVTKSTPTRPNEYQIDWTQAEPKPVYGGVKITTPNSGVVISGVMGGNLEPESGDRVVIAITTEPSLTNHHIEPSILKTPKPELVYVDDAEDSPPFKKKPKIAKSDLDSMIGAIGNVLGYDMKISSNWGKSGKWAKELIKADYTPQHIRQLFGSGGPWWTETWQGKKGQMPTPKDILNEIGKLSRRVATTNGKESFEERRTRRHEMLSKGRDGN